MRRFPFRMLTGLFVLCLLSVAALVQAPEASGEATADKISIEVQPTIFFVGEAGALLQKCEVILDYAGPEAVGDLRIRGFAGELRQALPKIGTGKHVVFVYLPDHAKPVRATFSARVGNSAAFKTVVLAPQRKWSIFLLPNSHTDIGYTELQSRVAKNQAEYLDKVVEFCRATDGYPDEAKFRWNIEVAWALENYIKNRPTEKVQALVNLLRSGRVELSGWYVQLSDMFAHEELIRAVLPAKDFSRALAFPLGAAMNNDVTGFSWAAPQVLSQAGIHYFAVGINETRASAPLRRPNPFYWQSPDGAKILVWNGEHYLFSNLHLLLHKELAESEPRVAEYLAKLQSRGDYPYGLIAFPIGGRVEDNSPPQKELSDRVREWNVKWAFPKLRLATMSDFFGALERNYAAIIPTHKKAWPDYCTDGVGSAAYETGLNRLAHDDLATAEKFAAAASLADPAAAFPKAEIREGYAQTMLFDEHTWGAYNSISGPEEENVRGQWAEKSAFVYNAREIAGTVRNRSLSVLAGAIASGADLSLAVFNPLSWARTDVVRVALPKDLVERKGGFRLIEKKTGAEVFYQIVDESTLLFQADNVPSIGYSVYSVVPGAPPSPPAPSTVIDENRIENRFFKVMADAETGGLRSVIDKESGRELVDPASPYLLDQFIYENAEGGRAAVDNRGARASFKRYPTGSGSAAPGLQGPVASSLVLTSRAFRHPDIRQEIVLYDGLKRIDIVNRLRKEETFEPEAAYFAFPFRIDGGRFRFEIADAAMAPEIDQLPGTTRDWFAVQNWVEAAGPKSSVVWSPVEAPLVQFGDINTGKWLGKLDIPNQTVFSYILNNLWMTNFKASQGGPLVFRYAFTSRPGGADPVASARFGAEARTPFVAEWLPKNPRGSLPEGGLSFFAVDQPNVLIQTVTAAESGEGIVVRLREIGGIETRARISSDLFTAETLTYAATDIGENPANTFEVVPRSIYVDLRPFQIVTVKIKNPR
ncbi:MAG: glycosyl hydrolase-related protein [Candidatus Aminicenantes bacterium]|nr:glycosyl hydrolase-related protein [Candidatus Aminicenantes bacterium]